MVKCPFMKNHFIFDLDDTLTNSYEFNQQMFVDTFLVHDKKVDQNYLRELHFFSRGKAMHVQFEDAIKRLGLNIGKHQLVKENEELHIKNIDQIKIFEDVHDLFKTLKEKNKKISICTNRQYGSLKIVLNNNKLTKYLDNIVSCTDEGLEKPDPTCLLRIIEKYDIPKKEYLYFGDSKTDSEFAAKAGIDYIIIDHYLNQKKFYKIILQTFLK